MVVVCNFFDKTIEMPLEDEVKEMQILLANYSGIEDTSVLRPYEARIYIKETFN